MRARIAQCLCPKRHAILGVAVNDSESSMTNEGMVKMLRSAVAVMIAGRGEELGAGLPAKLNPNCGLCGAPRKTWIFEVRRTKEFETWEEAKRELEDLETAQMLTHMFADWMGISYDAKQRNKKASMN